MLIAVIVIAYIAFLRYLYEKKVGKERQKTGIAKPVGLADFSSLKRALSDISDHLTALESAYRELAEREGRLRL